MQKDRGTPWRADLGRLRAGTRNGFLFCSASRDRRRAGLSSRKHAGRHGRKSFMSASDDEKRVFDLLMVEDDAADVDLTREALAITEPSHLSVRIHVVTD